MSERAIVRSKGSWQLKRRKSPRPLGTQLMMFLALRFSGICSWISAWPSRISVVYSQEQKPLTHHINVFIVERFGESILLRLLSKLSETLLFVHSFSSLNIRDLWVVFFTLNHIETTQKRPSNYVTYWLHKLANELNWIEFRHSFGMLGIKTIVHNFSSFKFHYFCLGGQFLFFTL